MEATSVTTSAGTTSALMRIPPLDSSNYRQWSFAMKFLLDGEDLWELVNPAGVIDAEPQGPGPRAPGVRTRAQQGTPAPPVSDLEKRKTKKATHLIYQSCATIPQSHIAHEKDPAKMWSILEDLYSRINDDNEAGQALFEEFWMEQFKNYKTVDEYGAKLKTYQDQLAITERRLPDSSLIQQLTKQLPFHYDDIVTAIRMNKGQTTFRQALKMLIEREKTLGSRKQSKALVAKSGKANASALVGTTGSGNHRKPHWKKNHRGKPYDRQNQQSNQQPQSDQPPKKSYDPKKQCWYCARTGHIQNECRIRWNAEQLKKAAPSVPAPAQAPAGAPASRRLFAAIAHASIAAVQNDPTLAADINELIATGSNSLPLADNLEDRICFNAD